MKTPSDIEVVMYHHFLVDPHPRADAPAVSKAVQRYIRDGILAPDGEGFTTTAKGRAWVKLLCAVPYPTGEQCDHQEETPGNCPQPQTS
jgi:hypothetical protein